MGSTLVVMLPELTTGFMMAYSSNGLYKFMSENGSGFVLDIDEISWISKIIIDDISCDNSS